jgi:tetratricopeptide (TPR) repeat protein
MTETSGRTTGLNFADYMSVLQQEASAEKRLRLCEKYLDDGSLGRREIGVLHGCMGATYFELGYDRWQAAKAASPPSQADLVQVERDMRESLQQYTSAIGMNPGNYLDHWNRGLCYEFLQDLDHALSDYTQAVQIKPDFAEGYLYRARILERQGETEKAAADLREAHRLPRNMP